MDRYPVLAARRSADAESAPVGRSRWMFWLVILGLVSLLGSVAVTALSLHPLTPAKGPVSDSSAARNERRAVAVAYVDVEGGVRPLFPAVPGRVIEAPVPEGKEVAAGTVLLRIDDALAQARLKEAKLDHLAAKERLEEAKKLISQHKTGIIMQQNALEAAKEKLAAAESQAGKARRLAGLGGTAEDVETAASLVKEAKAGVRVQEAKLRGLEDLDPQIRVRLARFDADSKAEQVEKAELGVRECRIVAPCKGMILRRLVNVGEVLGTNTNRPAIEFCPSDDRIVRAEVEQEFASKLRVGLKARISDDITGSGEWHGEVVRISNWYTQRRAVLLEPMQYNDIRTLEVIIRLYPDSRNPLRINQRVRVRLDTEP